MGRRCSTEGKAQNMCVMPLLCEWHSHMILYPLLVRHFLHSIRWLHVLGLGCELPGDRAVSECPVPIPFTSGLMWIREVSVGQASLCLSFGSYF